MQRETALALLGIIVLVILLLVAYATQMFRPTQPTPSSTSPPPKVTTLPAASSPLLPPTASLRPSLSVPTTPIVTVPPVPETPPTMGHSNQPLPALPPMPLNPTVLPSVPRMGTPRPSPFVFPSASSLNEAVQWAKKMVEQARPRWQVQLLQTVDARLGREGFAFIVNGNQLEIYARTPVGWLYGLLEVADRLRNGDEIPSRWRWQPPLAERGWVEKVTSVASAQWSASRLRAAVRERLRMLAWQRFNVWVLESTGQEAVLPALLTEARSLAPFYGVRVVLWAPRTPTVQVWQSQGGIAVSTTPSLPNTVLIATDPTATRWLDTQSVAMPLQDGHFFVPTLPPFVNSIPRRLRSRLILVGGLEGAQEGLFWFDPEWAQALVRAMRDEGVGGFWLQVRSLPLLWGAAAFSVAWRNPDADAEHFWERRWSRQWGASARLWLVAFREASRIMPDLLTLLGTASEDGRPFRPQWGVPLPLFFSRRPLSPDWGISVLSVPETLRQANLLNHASPLTATDIAQRLHQRADTVLATLAHLPDPTDPEWQQAKRGAILNGWLGKHFAFKVEAALAWGRFEAGDRTAGKAVVAALDGAVQAWQQVVAAANALYGPANEWARRLLWWQQEAHQYRARLAQAPALP